YMMVLNPVVEIYLLDSEGLILSYFTHPHENLERNYINLKPVIRYIEQNGFLSIQGDDPRTKSSLKPFSAAKLVMGNKTGYVYVILRGQNYDQSLAMQSSFYYIRTGLITFIIAIIATLFAGFFLFFLLTQRLRRLTVGVKAFEDGNFKYRVNIKGKDELAKLGKAFNDMAQSIEDGLDKLHLAEKQRGELIANISHDLRSPLTSIRGYLETILLKDDNLSLSERREYIDISLKNISNFQKLVEELFELAKLEAKQIEPQLISFSLAELIQDVIMKVRPLSDRKNIVINYSYPSQFLSVLGDIGMIERVITNVLENGISHTPIGGNINVIFTISENLQVLKIVDNGPGIPNEDLPHIFERFYKSDKSRNRDIPGTGLGLAIAKEMVELNNGSIYAESLKTGGASFSIIFPNIN
ncbi:MAG: HAMP domain-containing histidine kinase, partial [Spirochaetales bacterium]|nr:HAMP domain-containing histidine kinase [Spirochaetales bacterium]